MKIAFIGRAQRFSPNSAANDTAILAAVRQQLSVAGYDCMPVVDEETMAEALDMAGTMESADALVSMGRAQHTLNWLAQKERQGVPVVNSPAGVRLCNMRCALMDLLDGEVCLPPSEGTAGYWVKRGSGCAQSTLDVQFAATRNDVAHIQHDMAQRGITDVLVQAHVTGDVLKCYGVRGTSFFRAFYPSDDGVSKFGDERHNGPSHHYAYDAGLLREQTERVAERCSLDVYGADFIIRPDGVPVLIDLNDWPSYSRCRDEAAEAIARRIMQRLNNEN